MNAAETLAACGLEVAVADGELIAGVVLLTKVVEADGDVRLSVAWSDGLSFIDRRGMIEEARDLEIAGWDGDDR